jgi:hypothetical protein
MVSLALRARRTMALGITAALAAAVGCQRDGDVAARAQTTPGGGGQQLHSGTRPAAMTITPDLLRTWSEQLCTLPPLDFAGALQALGIAGSLVSKTRDYSIIEPPPAGTSRLGLTLENLGKNKGNLGEVEVTLAGSAITRSELDRRFGAGNVGARVDFDRPFVVTYRVEVPGAPFRCRVLASFSDEPAAASAATAISLLRDVVKPPPGQAP